MSFDDVQQKIIEDKATEEMADFLKRFVIDQDALNKFDGTRGAKPALQPDAKSILQSVVLDNSASNGKVIDFLLQLQNQHEDKIKHYDNLRQANVKYAFTAFGALFTIGTVMLKLNLQIYYFIPLLIIMLICTLTMRKTDEYFHSITHRATTIKNYLTWIIAKILEKGKNTEPIPVMLIGYYDFPKDVTPNKKSSLAINYNILIWGSILSFLYFLGVIIIKQLGAQ